MNEMVVNGFGGAYRLEQGDDRYGRYLRAGETQFYEKERNEVELLTPKGWIDVFLCFDEDENRWLALTDKYSKERGRRYPVVLDVSPVGMFARIPRW